MRRAFASLLCAGLAACVAPTPPPDTATLPPGVFGPLNQDVPATEYAQYAFSDAARTYGDPVAGAKAVLAIDYIAGALNTNPHWANVDATTQMELLQARKDVRAAVGIAANAPSQQVVNGLETAVTNLAAGNPTAAAAALDTPTFPAGGTHTLEVLANLPYIRSANVATQHAANALFEPGDSGSPFQP